MQTNNSQSKQLPLQYGKPLIIIPNKRNAVLIFSAGEAIHRHFYNITEKNVNWYNSNTGKCNNA